MTLTNAQVVDCRRYAGYSVSGDPAYEPYRELVYTNATYFGSLSLDTRLANLQAEEETVITMIMLPNLHAAESGIGAASGNLDTDAAAVWKHNKDEVSDRVNHYRYLRYDLCTFLGVPPGPTLAAANRVVRA